MESVVAVGAGVVVGGVAGGEGGGFVRVYGGEGDLVGWRGVLWGVSVG